MNVRIQYNMNWRAGIWFEGRLQMNSYDVALNMTTNSRNEDDHIVSLGRVKHFVYNELESTIFINQEETERIQLLNEAGLKLTTLPEEPIDQIVGLVLFRKLNAILENRLILTDISICSDFGDNIQYLHCQEEISDTPFGTGWWEDSSPVHQTFIVPNKKKQVVKLARVVTWADFDLAWPEEQNKTPLANDTGNTVVVFRQFTKDED